MSNKIRGIIIGFCCVIAIILFIVFSLKFEIFSRGSIGEQVIYALYDFESVEDLSLSDDDLKKLVTDEVYTNLSVTNSDKALNTYLKFKEESVSVEILETRPGSILYTLNTNSLSSGRKFLLLYDVNIFGKVSYAREMECIDFY